MKNLQVAPHGFHVLLVAEAEGLQTPAFFRQNDPVGRELENQHKAEQEQGTGQHGDPNKTDEIGHIHGVAGKTV